MPSVLIDSTLRNMLAAAQGSQTVTSARVTGDVVFPCLEALKLRTCSNAASTAYPDCNRHTWLCLTSAQTHMQSDL